MEQGNSRVVYVVQVDNSKDLSDAKRYGQLRAIFGKPRKPYDTSGMIARARRLLKDWVPGDYLLMIGDPTLCAVCMTVVAEFDDRINILSWNRDTFEYVPQIWDFVQQGVEFNDFEPAED